MGTGGLAHPGAYPGDGLGDQKQKEKERNVPQQANPFGNREITAAVFTSGFLLGVDRRKAYIRRCRTQFTRTESGAEPGMCLNDVNRLLPWCSPRPKYPLRLFSLVHDGGGDCGPKLIKVRGE